MSSLPLVVGRYAVHDEIACGGMASVHMGRLLGAVGFARTVAIKRLHRQYARDPEFVSMLLDEARLASRIRHPNVVPTLDVIALDGELFLVMEYVHGVALSRALRHAFKSGIPIPPDVVVSIVLGALHGLHAAHEATNERGEALQIVHRDVSPQNIMIGSDGLARVLDFGVAKASWRVQTTRDGQLKGKLAYMAPEQVIGDPVGPWTDVYAMAIVLWEALTNRRLFGNGDREGLLARFLHESPITPPSELVPGLPPALDQVVQGGLAHDPRNRFHSALEMAEALEASYPAATTSQVARWAQATMGEDLEQYTARMSAIERDSASLMPLHEDSSSQSGRRSLVSTALTLPAGEDQRESGELVQTSLSYASALPPRSRSHRKALMFGATTLLLFVPLVALALAAGKPSSSETKSLQELPSFASEPVPAAKRSVTSQASDTAAHSGAIEKPKLSPASSTQRVASEAKASEAASDQAMEPSQPTESKPEQVEKDARAKTPQTKTRSVRKTATRRATRRRASRASNKANCNPPYYTDARGVRHLKLSCFKK